MYFLDIYYWKLATILKLKNKKGMKEQKGQERRAAIGRRHTRNQRPIHEGQQLHDHSWDGNERSSWAQIRREKFETNQWNIFMQ